MNHSNLTVDSELLSTTHDRERRMERQIDKITLQEARRYGMAEEQNFKTELRIKYTYAGHVFIYSPKRNRAVTSYRFDSGQQQYGGQRNDKVKKPPVSGTRFYKPNVIHKSQDHDIAELKLSHDEMTALVYQQQEKWVSHTVIVVDMSGSMRDDDVDGARCRSDGVWTALARDYIKQQLEKEHCSIFDVVSVIAMRAKAQVVIHCEPMTYVLYNKLVEFREWDNIKPKGHGNYKPALEQARELLSINANGTCALNLMFFSDGKPSDYHSMNEKAAFSWVDHNKVMADIVKTTGNIASTFGRRLTITCVGIAGRDEKFSTLDAMANEAKMFGAQASFYQPQLKSTSLSEIVTTSLASSLSSKLELTSTKTGNARHVRTDVIRERMNAPDDLAVNDSWRVFCTSNKTNYVQSVWVWSHVTRDFARVIDPRCHVCYTDVVCDSYTKQLSAGKICNSCTACFFCDQCFLLGHYRRHQASKDCNEFANQRRSRVLVGGSHCPLSYNVAWKKKAFGEGAERLAFKFRFLDKDDNFTGPVMVAKESRFVEDVATKNYLCSDRQLYHKSFLRTQSISANFARKFNKRISEFPNILYPSVVPAIEFVNPSIFELENSSDATSYNVLVEPLIEGKYKKFTDNFGAQAGIKKDFAEENRGVDLDAAAALLGRKYNPDSHADHDVAALSVAIGGLGIIEEGSSEEEDSDGDDSSSGDSSYVPSDEDFLDLSNVCDEDYLLAFSHFTYVSSRGKLMVVDLQGALQTNRATGMKTFVLTDPAIHHRTKIGNRRQYGRTNLHGKGMRAFFESHKCNKICKLFSFREKNTLSDLDKLYRYDRPACD